MNPLTDMSDEVLSANAATLSKSCIMFNSDHYGSTRSSPSPIGDNEHVDEGNLLSTVAIPLPCAANVSVPGTPSVNYASTAMPTRLPPKRIPSTYCRNMNLRKYGPPTRWGMQM